MQKKLISTLCTLMVCSTLFTGCGKKDVETNEEVETLSDESVSEDDEEEDYYEYEEPEFTGEYGSYQDGAEWGNNFEGSAVYLEGKTAVVTIAVSTSEEPFTEQQLKSEKEKAKTALDFLTKSAKEYKKTAEFFFDEEDLNYTYQYEGDSVSEFESDDYAGILDELIRDQINTTKIREKYQADGIAYLFILNGQGDSFAAPHFKEDDIYFTSEGAYVFTKGYNEDYEEIENGPAMYAYQLLRLFGAVELAEPDATYGYTTQLCNIVRDQYADDIMFSMLDDSKMNTKKITKKIMDITAYSLGLTDAFKELKDNQVFTKDNVASFVDNYMKNTNDNEDTSAYDWDEAWDEEDESVSDDEDYFYDEEYEDDVEDDESYDDETYDDETYDETYDDETYDDEYEDDSEE